jgi:hypothetical protein
MDHSTGIKQWAFPPVLIVIFTPWITQRFECLLPRSLDLVATLRTMIPAVK